MNALRWWAREQHPENVAAVLDFAYLRDGEVDPCHYSACHVFGLQAEYVRWLAELLDRIERLNCGTALQSELAEWLGVPGAHVYDRSHAADALADEYRRDAVGLARSVAESMQTARSAA